jgi:hypothetical protein
MCARDSIWPVLFCPPTLAAIAGHLGKFHSSQEAFDLFRPTIAGAIERGRIEVRVPPTLFRSWKNRCLLRERQQCPEGRFAG